MAVFTTLASMTVMPFVIATMAMLPAPTLGLTAAQRLPQGVGE